MRLPLAIPLDARTGEETKDARLTNAVVENYEGRLTVSKRPGLSKTETIAGAANGVVCFNGTLISLFGTTIYKEAATDLFNLQFEGVDGSQALTNAGTGGTLTGDGDDGGHSISTTRSSVGSSSLKIATENWADCGTNIATSFFDGNYDISMDMYVSSSGLLAGQIDAFFDLITTFSAGNQYNVGLAFETSSANEVSIYAYVGNISLQEQTEAIQIETDRFFSIEISKRADHFFFSAGGRTVELPNAIPSTSIGAVVSSQLLYAYQLDFIWPSPGSKLYIDNFKIQPRASASAGTVAAGQYDFAQSPV